MTPVKFILNNSLLILILVFANSILAFGYELDLIQIENFPEQQIDSINKQCLFDNKVSDVLSIEVEEQNQARNNFTIDQSDTVFLDLSASTLAGNIIEFPVNISSDDYVYAVDFALKYSNQNVEFDTIINTTPGLNYLYYLNPNDSVLRFTSYRLGQIQNGTDVVKLKFTSLNGIICNSDFSYLTGYLNGDQCSIVSDSCSQVPNFVLEPLRYPSINIYPNPANYSFNIKTTGVSYLEIYDSRLNLILEKNLEESITAIDVSDYRAGVYFLKLTSNADIKWEKVIVAR